MRDEQRNCRTDGGTAAISGLSRGGWAMAVVVAAVRQWHHNNQLKKYRAVAAKGESKGEGNGSENNRGSSNSGSGSGSGSQGRDQGQGQWRREQQR
jgi:hypothetical protein